MVLNKKNHDNILILNHRGLGDVLMSYPAIRWLEKEYIGNIYMTVSTAFIEEVCKGEIGIKKYFLINAGPGGLHGSGFRWISTRRKAMLELFRSMLNIRSLKIDTVIGLSGYRFKDIRRFTRIIGAKKWIFVEEDENEVTKRNTTHKVDRHLKIISKYLGKEINPFLRNDYLFRRISNENRNKILPSDKYIVFAPGSGEYERFKRWPIREYISFGKYICNNYDWNIAIVGADYEKDLCNKIANGINSAKAKELCGKLSVSQLKWIYARSQFVIGADAGGMHFAKTCGAKVVVLFGPGNSSLCAPINSEIIIDLKVPGTPWYNRKNLKKLVHERNEYEPSMQIPSTLVIEKLKKKYFL